MPIETARISAFLETVEGKQQTQGYIPCDLVGGGTANYKGGSNPDRYIPMGVSGVTIGKGVDLGQTDATTLIKIGVSSATVNRLRPYLGQSGPDAVAVLHRLPLFVSQAVAEELDAAMIDHHISKIASYYDAAAGVGTFARLPWQAQAAIVSIQYQRGVKSPRKYPNTWAAFVRQDWPDAARRLMNGSLWDRYQSRRAAEGRLLLGIGG
ncbi:pesticin C-terminus-like muramidase [Desulfovibrio falkowii]|uniref:Pesticin C-terminal domain-containing protein n=1 Tax=Desulfovibrio falkowii TaxID=3136602 RepID=A0ABQ0EA11_9BACT